MLTSDEVYLHCVRMAEVATERAMKDPMHQQMTTAGNARWHVVMTYAGQENTASAFLVARRFGVFDPWSQRKIVVRGKERVQTLRLLPGYLLVFVWNVEDEKNRIRACPGVIDILRDGEGKAVVVPDDLIDYLQGRDIALSAAAHGWAEELGIDPALPLPVKRDKAKRDKSWSKKNKKKKKGKSVATLQQAPQLPPIVPVEIATIRPYSALEGIDELADDQRISLFNTAIGLGS